MPQATVKSYDAANRSAVLVADDGVTEYEVDAEAMEAGMFRFLRPGQRVTFDLTDADQPTPRNLRIGIV
jgi:cold shock CspA family protein